ncbi:hypothetical protein AB3X55_12625 [Alphaproteobacteria bacterium LSUCC0719]
MLSSSSDGYTKHFVAVAITCLLALAVLAWNLVTLYGHDYAYFLPRLLDNHLFYLANGLGLKEYTASFCAGIFEFANPQSVALSLPQLLSSLFGPVAGVKLTFVLSSAAAGLGIYGCARFAGLPHMSAAISGILMTFSGFLLTRMIVGHLTFFNVGFASVVSMLMLFAVRNFAKGRLAQAISLGGMASLLATSIVYGGAGVMILQIAAMILLLLVVCGGFAERCHHWLLVFGGVSVAALLMSAPKLEAMLAVTGNLPRDLYPLPGVALTDLPLLVLQTVLWVPGTVLLNDILQNAKFTLGWHEWNYSVSPLWLLVVGGGIFMGHRAEGGYVNLAWAWLRGSPMRAAATGLILLLPIILNVYTPSWNAVLKAAPLLGDSSNMLRWFLVYLPALCLVAGWTWRHVSKVHLVPLLTLSIALAGQQYFIHNTHLAHETKGYDRAFVVDSWQSGRNKEIFAVGAPIKTNKDGTRQAVVSSDFDHMFVDGLSNAFCYEPMFGYRLENLDRRYLRVGAINIPDQNGFLPMKNPSCYVYPDENTCRPGAHFNAKQFNDLQLLTVYGNLSAKTSALRSVLNLVAGAAFAITIATMIGGIWWTRRRRPLDDAVDKAS